MIRKGQPAHFLTSKRKQQLLQGMKLEEQVKVTQKEVESSKELVDANFKQFLQGTSLTKVATFKKENVQGDWAQQFLKVLPSNTADCSDMFKNLILQKTTTEIASLRVSSKFTEYCTRQLIDYIEHLIDQDQMQTVGKISAKIEALLDSDLTKFKQ